MKSDEVIFQQGFGHFLMQLVITLVMTFTLATLVGGGRLDFIGWVFSFVLSAVIISGAKHVWRTSPRGKSWLVIFSSISLVCIGLSWLVDAVMMGFAVGVPLAVVFATMLANMHDVAADFEQSMLESRLQ